MFISLTVQQRESASGILFPPVEQLRTVIDSWGRKVFYKILSFEKFQENFKGNHEVLLFEEGYDKICTDAIFNGFSSDDVGITCCELTKEIAVLGFVLQGGNIHRISGCIFGEEDQLETIIDRLRQHAFVKGDFKYTFFIVGGCDDSLEGPNCLLVRIKDALQIFQCHYSYAEILDPNSLGYVDVNIQMSGELTLRFA